MRSRKWESAAVRSLVLGLLFTMLLARPALAKRWLPPLDTAAKEATVIVLGRVTGTPADERREVIEIAVEKCWKGAVIPGDKVLCLSPMMRGDGPRLNPDGLNLLFLQPARPQDIPALKPGAIARPCFDAIDLKSVHDAAKHPDLAHSDWERAVYARAAIHERQAMEASQRILDVLFIDKPSNPLTVWRAILAKENNPALLTYAAEHLPQPLSHEDAALLVQTILRTPRERDAVDRMCLLLNKAGYQWETAAMRQAVESGAPVARVAWGINARNIQALQEPIFQRLSTPGDEDFADVGMLQAVARLSPEFARQKLRDGNFPFDIELPLLHELKINGSAVGRRDYPESMLKANMALVRQIGQMVRGEGFGTFSLEFEMEYRHSSFREDWRVLAPLLSPLLTSPDPARRRVTAAFLRTMGYTVQRDADKYVYDASVGLRPAPLAVSIVKPTAPVVVGRAWKAQYLQTARETQVAIAVRCKKVNWRLVPIDAQGAGETGMSTQQGNWTAPSQQPGDFVELKPGESAAGENELGPGVFTAPGRYRLTLSVMYMDAGEAAGIDAWSGSVISEPIEIQVN